MNVRIEELPAMRVGAIRHVGSYNNLSAAFANLAPIIERDGAHRTFKPRIRATRPQAIVLTLPAFGRFPTIAVHR